MRSERASRRRPATLRLDPQIADGGGSRRGFRAAPSRLPAHGSSVAPSLIALLALGCGSSLAPHETGAGGAGGSAMTSSGPGGGAGGSATGCDPSVEKTAVDTKCGTFVSASKGDDMMGSGTKEKPFKSIAKAIASGTKNLHLCGEKFSEAVTLPAGTSLFGGLKCAGMEFWQPGQQGRLRRGGEFPVLRQSM